MVVPVNIGLLIIRGNTNNVKRKLQRLLELAASKVTQKLYVHLEESDSFEELLPAIYLSAACIKSEVDFRVLLDRKTVQVDKVFYDKIKDPDQPPFPIFNEVKLNFSTKFNLIKAPFDFIEKPFRHVVLGGAFDKLHNGHKLLLSEAVFRSTKITCGVTDGDMIKKKVLYELMEPIKTRCANVENFVKDISENVNCITVPIYDAFGPSIEDNKCEAIIVSDETLKGAEAVNDKRKEKGLRPLKIHPIKLLGNEQLNDKILKEIKLSSSAKRREMLGSILREPKDSPTEIISNKHYLIGLTGGIASGKTHIAKYLASQGCEVIECDQLVHKIYSESEELRNKLAEEFGFDILVNGNIDRKKLGELVFEDKQKLQRLNNIVWPITFERVKEIIRKSEREIVVIDAALLLEAGWGKYLNQVWCTFVPKNEAIERIVARDNVPKENAMERLASQLTNSERISESNVVFCSLWEYSETERQVSKALELIRNDYLPK
uniref:Cytidyltransferase-like domain-containing protein n=1 Tax=Meloidogyne incognita TaxID=6306 RepID=A0A914KNV6_MELIC